MLRFGDFERDPAQFFEWVKFRSHLSRGVTVGTMLMDEALHFMRLGTFLERADNTASLVDVKFHAVQSDFFGNASEKDQEYDFYHWSAILRSVSGFLEIYRKVYRDVIKPERVADLLVLRADMPRSLHASLNEVVANLAMVANDQFEPRPSAAPASCARNCSTATSRKSSPTACMPSSRSSWTA